MIRCHSVMLALVVLFGAAGCANLSTIDRTTNLPHGGKAIHLDAPQRVVFSDEYGNVCAEPSPDALQAYAASLGASLAMPDKDTAASIVNSLAGSSASIGLRTQSITLMRDQLYRICEAYRNGQIEGPETVQLIQRSQDLTLGVLAIEQLTGAVVARQAVLYGNSNSDTAANVSNTKAFLDSAKTAEQQKSDALDKAKQDQQAKASAFDAAEKALAAASADKKDELTAERDQKKQDRDKADAAVKTAESEYATAKAAREAIEAEFNRAVATAKSGAATGGSLADTGRTGSIDKDTATVVSAAAADIVNTIANKGYLTNFCIQFMTQHSKDGDGVKSPFRDEVLKQCTRLIDSYIASQTAYQQARAAASSSAAPASAQDSAKPPAAPAKPAAKPDEGKSGGGAAPAAAARPFVPRPPSPAYRAPMIQ